MCPYATMGPTNPNAPIWPRNVMLDTLRHPKDPCHGPLQGSLGFICGVLTVFRSHFDEHMSHKVSFITQQGSAGDVQKSKKCMFTKKWMHTILLEGGGGLHIEGLMKIVKREL